MQQKWLAMAAAIAVGVASGSIAQADGSAPAPQGSSSATPAPSASAAPASSTVDFTLETTAGKNESLSDYRGKVCVVFYEDRHHVDTNLRVKDAVANYGAKNKLNDKVAIIAVANLKGFGVEPAATIARKAIMGIAKAADISIWFDWKGIVIDKLGVQDSNANVVVVDKQGVIKWKKSGRLSDQEMKDLLAQVQASL